MRRNSAKFRLYVQNCAAVVVEGATVPLYAHGATTMLALGLVLNTVGIGLVLLADLRACSLCLAVFRRRQHRHVGVS